MHVSLAAAGVLLATLAPRVVVAGVAWGDASLSGDDVRVDVDRAGVALVTHTIRLHNGARRFHGFVIDGVDADAEAPTRRGAALRDGPGWAAEARDGKDAPVEAFVEPAREARRLRVRLGGPADGVPRGDYTLRLAYEVDLSRAGRLARDGAMIRLAWEGPSWPEGYHSGHLTFALPAAPTAPRLALADALGLGIGAGDLASVSEGGGLTSMRRTPSVDEVEVTRPHVPHHDDARWVVSIDPKAFDPAVGGGPSAAEDSRLVARGGADRSARLRLLLLESFVTLATALVAAFALARRDRDAQRAARARGYSFQPLIELPAGNRGRASTSRRTPRSIDARAWPRQTGAEAGLRPGARAAAFGGLVGGATVSSYAGAFALSSCALVAALLLATLRPPRPRTATRAAGRWLLVPWEPWGPGSHSARREAGRSPFDFGTSAGRIVAALFACGVAALVLTCSLVAPGHPDIAAAIALHAAPLSYLFMGGRVGQLPPDVAADAAPRLREIRDALASIPVPTRLVAYRARAAASVEELRLLCDVTERGRQSGAISVEIGCAVSAGIGGAALRPELMVRLRDASVAHRAFMSRVPKNIASATFEWSLGRNAAERVLAIRPAFGAPANIRRWVRWVQRVLVVEPSGVAPRDRSGTGTNEQSAATLASAGSTRSSSTSPGSRTSQASPASPAPPASATMISL